MNTNESKSLVFDKITTKKAFVSLFVVIFASAGIFSIWYFRPKDDTTEPNEMEQKKSENTGFPKYSRSNDPPIIEKDYAGSKDRQVSLGELSSKVVKEETVQQKQKPNSQVSQSDVSKDSNGTVDVPTTGKPASNANTTKSDDKRELQERTALTDHPNFFKLYTCASSKASFCEAHLQFINNLKGICERETCSVEDKANLNAAFLKAKALYDNSDDLMTKVYGAANSSEAAGIIFDPQKIDFEPDLSNMVHAEKSKILRIMYDLFFRARLLGIKNLFKPEDFTFNNYDAERKSFIEGLYVRGLQRFFDKKLQSHLLKELEKPEPNLQPIVDWWLSYKLKLPPNDHLSFTNEFIARDVVDIKSAAKYALSKIVNKCISDSLNGDKKHAQEEYIRLRVSKYFDFPPTLPEFMSKYYTSSSRVLSVQEAVVDTPPKRIEFDMWCFASSYTQSMANFLPLFQKTSGWNDEKNGSIVENQKKVFSEVANGDGKPLNVRNLFSWPPRNTIDDFSPLRMILGFRSDVGANELAFNQIFGMFYDEGPENTQYFPPYLIYPEIQRRYLTNLRLIGQLFVSYIPPNDPSLNSNSPQFYDPVDLPLTIYFNVIDSDKPKRFELYSFIMARHSFGRPHVVSYVRRANGQWYLCDDISGNEQISDDKLPNTIASQKIHSPLQRPFMAYYLRVEQ